MFDAMVARHNGIFGGCWCIWFHPDSDERGQSAEADRALKKRYVAILVDAKERRPPRNRRLAGGGPQDRDRDHGERVRV